MIEPSDRIYLLRWIFDRCTSQHNIAPIEGVDFAILIYGGKSAKNYSLKKGDKLNILHANPNYFVIGDKDKGKALAWNNLLREALSLPNSDQSAWQLEVRTIEDFCSPKKVPSTIKSRKVKHASRLSVHPDWQDSVNREIDRLLTVIASWGPQFGKVPFFPHAAVD